WPFRVFNAGFAKLTHGYVRLTDFFLRRILVGMALVAVMVAITWQLSTMVPSTLVPNEDQGVVVAVMSLPSASSLARTNEVRDALSDRALNNIPAIKNITAFSGFDFLSSAPSTSSAVAFISLKPWEDRDTDSFQVVNKLMGLGMGIPQAQILSFNPPPIMGLSTTGGVEAFVQSTGGADYGQIKQDVSKLVAA